MQINFNLYISPSQWRRHRSHARKRSIHVECQSHMTHKPTDHTKHRSLLTIDTLSVYEYHGSSTCSLHCVPEKKRHTFNLIYNVYIREQILTLDHVASYALGRERERERD